MSNIATIQSAITQAFDILGDLVGTFTLKRSVETFNPATSDVTSVSSTIVGQGVFHNDKTAFFSTTELSKGRTKVWVKFAVPPELTDVMVLPDGSERSILEIKPVQANTTVFIYECILGA